MTSPQEYDGGVPRTKVRDVVTRSCEMTPRDGRYSWLYRSMEEVKTPKFHLVRTLPADDLDRIRAADLPLSYKRFAAEVGDARLFRELDGYVIGVYCPPKPESLIEGRKVVVFGHYDAARLCFDVRHCSDSSERSEVFRVHGESLTRISDTFEDWLQDGFRRARKRYSPREWCKICSGPRPFSARELDIVRARRGFSWRRVGITGDGRLSLIISNQSDQRIPFLTIGVRGPDLLGAVWVPVDDIYPGHSKPVAVDCYKDIVDPAVVEVYALPDPGPEDRDRYWEFRQLRASTKSKDSRP